MSEQVSEQNTSGVESGQVVGERSRGRARVIQGVVKSDKMDKSVVVEVSHRVMHKTYKKYVNRRVRYMAHDERNEYRPGDIVRIISARPMSGRKRWRVLELVERPA